MVDDTLDRRLSARLLPLFGGVSFFRAAAARAAAWRELTRNRAMRQTHTDDRDEDAGADAEGRQRRVNPRRKTRALRADITLPGGERMHAISQDVSAYG